MADGEEDGLGSILMARCPCGFESPELFEGTGMLAPPPTIPVACLRCERMFTVRQDLPNPKCRRCGSAVVKFEAERITPEPAGEDDDEDN